MFSRLNRVRDFWTESGPADVLSKLQRKEITLFRAAEQLNVTPQTLSNYLLSLHQGNDIGDPNSSQMSQYDGYEEMGDSDDEKVCYIFHMHMYFILIKNCLYYSLVILNN